MKIIPKSWTWRLVIVGLVFYAIISFTYPKEDVYWRGINLSQSNRDMEKFNNTPTLQLYREALIERSKHYDD